MKSSSSLRVGGGTFHRSTSLVSFFSPGPCDSLGRTESSFIPQSLLGTTPEKAPKETKNIIEQAKLLITRLTITSAAQYNQLANTTFAVYYAIASCVCYAAWGVATISVSGWRGGYFFPVSLFFCAFVYVIALGLHRWFSSVLYIHYALGWTSLQTTVCFWIANSGLTVQSPNPSGMRLGVVSMCAILLSGSSPNTAMTYGVTHLCEVIILYLLEWNDVRPFGWPLPEVTEPGTYRYAGHLLYQLTLDVALFISLFTFLKRVSDSALLIESEKQLSQRLLHNTLPAAVAETLLMKLRSQPSLSMKDLKLSFSHSVACILFCDICGFTEKSGNISAEELVDTLNNIVQELDEGASRHGVEKIKTIGDAYMAAAIPAATDNRQRKAAVASILNFSIVTHQIVRSHKLANQPLLCRIGIHCGKCVSGVIGISKFQYDLWGDTVNVASRMESTGQKGRTQVSTQIRSLAIPQYEFEYVGKVSMKGKGEMDAHLLITDRVMYTRKKEEDDSNGQEDVNYSYVPWLKTDGVVHDAKKTTKQLIIETLDQLTMEDQVMQLEESIRMTHSQRVSRVEQEPLPAATSQLSIPITASVSHPSGVETPPHERRASSWQSLPAPYSNLSYPLDSCVLSAAESTI